MNEDDLDGEVISVNGEDATPPDENTPVDRGDVVAVEPADPKADATADADERKTAGIPKARFDEVNERRKTAEQELEAAQAEIARLKSTPPTATPAPAPKEPAPAADPAFDEDAKEQAYIDAMLDGDSAKAKEIRKEINAHLRSQAASEVEERTTQRTARANLATASQKAIEDYPYLDTPDGEYALDLIVSARNAAMARGVPAHEALATAVANIAPRFAPDDKTTPSRGLPAPAAPTDTRTKQALERGALDSTRQPPALQAGLGNRTDSVRVNVENLDEAQFAALTAAEKKALRGD